MIVGLLSVLRTVFDLSAAVCELRALALPPLYVHPQPHGAG